jgi:hypothetical protein
MHMQDAQLQRSKFESEFFQEHRFYRQKDGVSISVTEWPQGLEFSYQQPQIASEWE